MNISRNFAKYFRKCWTFLKFLDFWWILAKSPLFWENFDRTLIWIFRMVRSLADRTFQLSGEHESLRRLPWATEADHEPQSLPLPPDSSPSRVFPGLHSRNPFELHAVLRVALRRTLVERFGIERFSDSSTKWSNFIGLVLFCIDAKFCSDVWSEKMKEKIRKGYVTKKMKSQQKN